MSHSGENADNQRTLRTDDITLPLAVKQRLGKHACFDVSARLASAYNTCKSRTQLS